MKFFIIGVVVGVIGMSIKSNIDENKRLDSIINSIISIESDSNKADSILLRRPDIEIEKIMLRLVERKL